MCARHTCLWNADCAQERRGQAERQAERRPGRGGLALRSAVRCGWSAEQSVQPHSVATPSVSLGAGLSRRARRSACPLPAPAPRPSEARLWAQSMMSECLCLLPHCPALRTASPFRSLPHVSGNGRNRSRRPDGSQDPERPRRWGRGVRRGFVAAFELLSLAVPAVTRQATASRRASRKLARLLTRKCTFHPASKMKHRKPKRACGCALLPRFWGALGSF